MISSLSSKWLTNVSIYFSEKVSIVSIFNSHERMSVIGKLYFYNVLRSESRKMVNSFETISVSLCELSLKKFKAQMLDKGIKLN